MDSEDDFERYLVEKPYRDDAWFNLAESDFHIKLHIWPSGLCERQEMNPGEGVQWARTFQSHDPAERQKPPPKRRPKTTKKSTLDDKYRFKGMERML